jgi:hypothetical protein
LVNLTILLKKKNISPLSEFPEAKNQREKKCTLGELWIMHNFSSHKKNNYLSKSIKNLGDIRHKLSIIYKRI